MDLIDFIDIRSKKCYNHSVMLEYFSKLGNNVLKRHP